MPTFLHIEKQESDPLAIRISAGGTRRDGSYIVYRGPIDKVRDILIDILAATTELQEMKVGEKKLIQMP